MSQIARNKFVRRVLAQVCESDPYIAVHKFVQKYREPGDKLDRVAERLGVRKITITKMGFDGGIFEEPSGLHVKINSASPPNRRRFTLAHELAHLILVSGNADGSRRSHACNELERACDLVAAELLMPLDKVTQSRYREPSVTGLLAMADECEASPHAMAVRLNELGIWRESVGQWSWDGNAHELWFVGKRFWREKDRYLAAFERAVRQGSFIGSEIIENLGRAASPVFLDVRRLGTQNVYLFAVMRDSAQRRLAKRTFGDWEEGAKSA